MGLYRIVKADKRLQYMKGVFHTISLVLKPSYSFTTPLKKLGAETASAKVPCLQHGVQGDLTWKW